MPTKNEEQVFSKQGEPIEEDDHVYTKIRGGRHEGDVSTIYLVLWDGEYSRAFQAAADNNHRLGREDRCFGARSKRGESEEPAQGME
jgi:hypothetical protein